MYPDAKIRYFASDMYLYVFSDTSYMNESKAQSTAGGHFFLRDKPDNNKPIKLNGAIHAICSILKLVAASAAEAKLGALFFNMQDIIKICCILSDLGHPQKAPTPLYYNNSTATVIV